jgi:hypothetical protein
MTRRGRLALQGPEVAWIESSQTQEPNKMAGVKRFLNNGRRLIACRPFKRAPAVANLFAECAQESLRGVAGRAQPSHIIPTGVCVLGR